MGKVLIGIVLIYFFHPKRPTLNETVIDSDAECSSILVAPYYRCASCPLGFKMSSNRTFCEDIDEVIGKKMTKPVYFHWKKGKKHIYNALN